MFLILKIRLKYESQNIIIKLNIITYYVFYVICYLLLKLKTSKE